MVYDLSPDLVGTFDFVFVGGLLLHLRDPVWALEQIRTVCKGELLLFDVFDPVATITRRRPSANLDGSGRNWWWSPNWQGLRRMMESAGWDVLERTSLIFAPVGAGYAKPPPSPLGPRGPARAARPLAGSASDRREGEAYGRPVIALASALWPTTFSTAS